MRVLLSNLSHEVRSMLRRPAFTAVTVLTLALGIGANTAIFSVIDAVLFKPLPYPEPGRLVALASNMSAMDLDDTRAAARSIESIGGVTIYPLDYTGAGEPTQVQCGVVDSGLFDALGWPAAMGRRLTTDDDRAGGARVALLSDRFWRGALAARPDAVGQTIALGGDAYTVVGVMPAGFQTPENDVDLWAPLRVVYPAAAGARGAHMLRTFARLAPGVTLERAQADFDAVAVRLEEIDPIENTDRRMRLVPLREALVGDTRPALLLLFGAVGFVLLIACANFANLLLARAASRRHETSIRAALGASRGRLAGEALTESVLYAALGGIAGLVVASWGLDGLLALAPENLLRGTHVGLDARVLAFTAGVSLLTGVVFGLAPAIAATRLDASDALSEGGRGVAGPARHRVRNALVVSEVALAVVLLVGSGLLINSFLRLRSVGPGFDASNLLTMRVDLPASRYAEIPPQTRFREQLVDRLEALPGVRAALVSEVPLGGNSLNHNVAIEGRDMGGPGNEPELYSRSVAGDYFAVMGIPVVAGRSLAREDRADALPVAVVNERMAREYFPDGDAIGSRFRWAREDGPPRWVTIVGVVGDVKHFGLDRDERPAVYTPYAQSTQSWKRWQTIVVRGAGAGAADLAGEVKGIVWALDPQLSVTAVRPMSEVMAASVAERRFTTALLGVFAAVALALSALGIYGVMAFSVAQRTREFGVRLALGAQTSDLLRLVVGQGLGLALVGAAIGVAGALALARLMSSLVFGVSVTDPATFAAAVAALVAVATLACYVPARHASRIDPLRALRSE